MLLRGNLPIMLCNVFLTKLTSWPKVVKGKLTNSLTWSGQDYDVSYLKWEIWPGATRGTFRIHLLGIKANYMVI